MSTNKVRKLKVFGELASREFVKDTVNNSATSYVVTVAEKDHGYVTDKKYSDIVDAYENGKTLIVKCGEVVLTLVSVTTSDDEVCFEFSAVVTIDELLYRVTVTIKSDSVLYDETQLAYHRDVEALKPSTDREVLQILTETGFVDPLTTSDDKFLTDNYGKIYVM